jgi:hypothetical protein
MVQILSWTWEIYDPKFLIAHKGTENKGVRHFNTLPSPTNLTVEVCPQISRRNLIHRSTPIRDKVLNLPASSSDLTVVSDHRSPDRTSSIDSILLPYTVISGFQEDRSSSCRVTKVLRLHVLFPNS